LRLVRETTIMTGGGTLAFDERMTVMRTLPRATIHPATASALRLTDGDRVTVSASGAALPDLTLVIDERVAPGSVALVDGIPEAPLNLLGTAVSVTLEKALAPV
jgi:predicted molibdopterin-dependent oxidoreductase YjgC